MASEIILAVDDHAANLKLLRYLLTRHGYDVRTAADAEEALAVLSTCRPVVILMDVQMPGVDGLELTRRIKANPQTQDIAVVAVTAYAMSGDAERARAAGCDAYVTKPIDVQALPALVARLAQSAKEG